MIPKSNYYWARDMSYITESLFKAYHTTEEWEVFSKWMTGQTCMVVDGVHAYYSWDYERWFNQGKKSEQGDDWD